MNKIKKKLKDLINTNKELLDFEIKEYKAYSDEIRLSIYKK